MVLPIKPRILAVVGAAWGEQRGGLSAHAVERVTGQFDALSRFEPLTRLTGVRVMSV